MPAAPDFFNSNAMKRKTLLALFCLALYSANTQGLPGKQFQAIIEDGAWCWFSDPRALYFKGQFERTYIGAVSSAGDVVVAQYDHSNGNTFQHSLFPQLQADDHVNPSLLALPDGRLMAFFTRHNGGFYYTKTLQPEDISQWEAVKTLNMGDGLCYTNPVILSEENNRIYVFSRGGYDWKPSYVYSDDLGASWPDPKVFISEDRLDKYKRPYTKVASDNKSRIYFAFTDGHPRNEPLNSIYVIYYEQGGYYQVDGSLITSADNLPVKLEESRKAYDADSTKVRSWIWDIALDKERQPFFVYTRLNEETRHQYYYARWDGSRWQHHKIAEGGSDFPRFPRQKEERNPEPHYSGGVYLDHENPSVVYLSRPEKRYF